VDVLSREVHAFMACLRFRTDPNNSHVQIRTTTTHGATRVPFDPVNHRSLRLCLSLVCTVRGAAVGNVTLRKTEGKNAGYLIAREGKVVHMQSVLRVNNGRLGSSEVYNQLSLERLHRTAHCENGVVKRAQRSAQKRRRHSRNPTVCRMQGCPLPYSPA
jgi:hypothetical protein